MVSLTVQIDDRLAELVRQLATAQQRSENEIVTEALAIYTQTKRPVARGIGEYHGGRKDTSQKADDILREAAREGEWL